jgi:hypothetical protein
MFGFSEIAAEAAPTMPHPGHIPHKHFVAIATTEVSKWHA